MAKKPVDRPEAPYHLYTRCLPGREPKTTVSVDEVVDGHVVGQTSKVVLKYGAQRGAFVAQFRRYGELVGYAQSVCEMLGIPKSRWVDIFDWNK